MALTPGTRLGPYEILSPLGSGGMGEVYRARDTGLERTVAIKVLPEHLSSSPEVRQRFEREARTISQLSHAHICALYGVGREGETEYLVMEYLEGETLTDRLARGPLPTEQFLRYGIEIADDLDKAHRQGILHRDLKPSNVMLTKSGVTLLAFGLAKAITPLAPVELSSLPTQASPVTQAGAVLGTVQYIAPEQLEGKQADAPTDIFAFGAVLYEVATGKKRFRERHTGVAHLLDPASGGRRGGQVVTGKRCFAFAIRITKAFDRGFLRFPARTRLAKCSPFGTVTQSGFGPMKFTAIVELKSAIRTCSELARLAGEILARPAVANADLNQAEAFRPARFLRLFRTRDPRSLTERGKGRKNHGAIELTAALENGLLSLAIYGCGFHSCRCPGIRRL